MAPAHFIYAFPGLLHTAEVYEGLPSRFVGGHAGGDVGFNLLFEMKGELIVQRSLFTAETKPKQQFLEHPISPSPVAIRARLPRTAAPTPRVPFATVCGLLW